MARVGWLGEVGQGRLARGGWLGQYLKNFGLEIGEMRNTACRQAFRFGPGKRYVSLEMIEVPIVVERTDGKDDVMKVQTYLVDAKVPFCV